MTEVHPDLWVGDEGDYEVRVSKWAGWVVIQACKEPYHRRALGYRGRGAPKHHPEYLFAYRDNRLILNMVDVEDPDYFAVAMIDEALDFLDSGLSQGLKMLVHCNQGESRSPAMALLYMAARLKALPIESFEDAEEHFKTLYPCYAPKRGIREHLRQNWNYYISGRTESPRV